jgi:uncharacterized protein YhfF
MDVRSATDARTVSSRRFDVVDAAFAFEEGEGDRSLAYWRSALQRYFTRLNLYRPDMRLWRERFELASRSRLD